MILAAALVAQAACPAPFAPPLDLPLTVTTSDDRVIGDRRYRSTKSYRLTFSREDARLAAELTLVALDIDAPAPVVAAYHAGEGALKDVPLHFSLSANGCEAELNDADAIATRIRAGGDAMLATRPAEGRATMERLTAHLREIDAAGAHAFVAETLAAVLPHAGARDAGPVQRDAASIVGEALTLTGRRKVSALPGGVFVREVYAGDGSRPSFEHAQRIDAASGLAIETIERSQARVGETVLTTVRTTTIAPW